MMGCSDYGKPGNLRMLLSYYYFRHLKVSHLIPERILPLDASGIDIIIDSGVYTARQMNELIPVESYGIWLKANKEWYNKAVTIDYPSRFSCVQSNTKRLDEIVPGKVMGCVQGYMTRDEIRSVIEQWDYVAVGTAGFNSSGKASSASWTKEQKNIRLRYFDIIFEEASRVGGRKLHGLSITKLDLLLRFPWYSVDSTSWTSVSAFGNVDLFDPEAGVLRRVKLYRRELVAKYSDLIAFYGGDSMAMLNPDTTSAGFRHRLFVMATNSYRKMEEWLVNYWRKHGAGDDYTLRLYLADSSGSVLRYIDPVMAAFRSSRPRTLRSVKKWNKSHSLTGNI